MLNAEKNNIKFLKIINLLKFEGLKYIIIKNGIIFLTILND